jgi:hypothetical protein
VRTRCFYYYFIAFGAFLSACSPIKNSKYEEYLASKYEVPECNQNYTYTHSSDIIGTAKFFKRGVNLVTQTTTNSSGSTLNLRDMTLGDPLQSPLPIKLAEVAVYNSNNQVVQCGVTDSAGDLKALDGISTLQIPGAPGTYIVRVYSRMNQTLSFAGKPSFKVNVSVKQDKYTNQLYYIEGQIQSNGVDAANVDLRAYARQTDSYAIEGGAFNILNAIYTGYTYIQNNTGTVNTTCLSNKFNVYWKAGFNPFQYAYPDSDPSTLAAGSYYDKASKSLFISGGKLGNITSEVTNQFDDFVIIHESAHHIEDVCGSLITPGGSHSIIVRIDPRKAWAEGWANYFAAEVMYNNIDSLNPEFRGKMTAAGFTDTDWTYLFGSEGFSDSVQNIGTGTGFMFDLKKAGNDPDTWQYSDYYGQPFDKVDPTKYPGEGHFREGAITRGLFKLTNNCDGTCITSTPINFVDIWKSMDKITGIGQSKYVFKSSEDLLENLKILEGANWTATYKAFNEDPKSEALHLFSDGAFTSGGINRWIPYGTYLTNKTVGSCSVGTMYIEPRADDPVLTGTNSDQRYSNHYYTIDLNLFPGLDQINVSFTKITPSGSNTEFDLLLFQDLDTNFVFNDDYACATYDTSGNCTSFKPVRGTNQYVVRSDRRAGTFSTKTIKDLSSLDKSKRYLLDIRAYTANKSINSTTDYQYTITDQNGALLCP